MENPSPFFENNPAYNGNGGSIGAVSYRGRDGMSPLEESILEGQRYPLLHSEELLSLCWFAQPQSKMNFAMWWSLILPQCGVSASRYANPKYQRDYWYVHDRSALLKDAWNILLQAVNKAVWSYPCLVSAYSQREEWQIHKTWFVLFTNPSK